MVDRPDRLDPIKKIGEEKMPGGPVPEKPTGSFESYMEKASQQPSKPTGTSPFELQQQQNQTLLTTPTFDSLLTQVKSAQSMLGDMNTHLNTKNLKLKSSQRYLLRNKLTDANSYLRAANTKMGAEAPSTPPSSGGGVIGKFLDYVSEGQANLATAQQQLMNLKEKGSNMNPADFLAIQLKLSHAQQEIQYASMLLANAVDALKTMFNIQL